MNRIFACFLACLTLLCVVSCSKTDKYRDDLSADELAKQVTAALGDENVYISDESHFTNDYFPLPDSVTEHTVRYVRDTNNIDEFGIYHVKEGGADELKTLLSEKYLEASYLTNRDWYDSYIPEETAKLRDAEVHTFGNYIVYAILDKEDRAHVFETVEKALKQ